jgi:hypothetical protein
MSVLGSGSRAADEGFERIVWPGDPRQPLRRWVSAGMRWGAGLVMAGGCAADLWAGQLAEIEAWLGIPAAERPPQPAAFQSPLGREDAARVLDLLGTDHLQQLAQEREEEMKSQSITLGGKTLRWEDRKFGQAPQGGHSLWISLHGGGGTRPEVNDSQWRNQIRLYEPEEGIYVAPRAPTDTWNLWHEGHIDPLFQRLIEGYVALEGVDPDKVHLLGYSAGGDGVWQLGPRMADRFASAAMMAGHPNEASLLGLRNLPFAIFMGGNDTAYQRHAVAAERAEELTRLREADAGGYLHLVRIYPGVGHWMDGKDREALPWMAEFRRDPWPRKVVWFQDDVLHDRFYWLKIPDIAAARAGHQITASVDGQEIRVDGDVPAGTEIRLSDRLLDLDQPVRVILNGTPLPERKVPRTAASLLRNLGERADLPAAATATIVLP